MDTHLSAEEIKNYLARRMTPGNYARTGKHMHRCGPCYQRFLGELETRFPIEIYLDEQAGLCGWHPEDEELAAYLVGSMDELDSDCVALHLRECGLCRVILQSTLDHLSKYPFAPRNRGKTPAPEWTRFRPTFPQSLSSHLRIAGIAALVIVVVLSLWAGSRRAPQSPTVAEVRPQEGAPLKGPSPEQTPPNPPVGDRLNQRPIPPRVEAYGEPGTRRIERHAHDTEPTLIATTLTMPPSIERLDRTPAAVAIRGNRPPVESFSVISPFATLVASDRPTFRWTPLIGAESYRVSLYDEALHLVGVSGAVTQTEWMTPDRLAAGIVYTWTVTALKGGNEIVAPAAPARAEFEVIHGSTLANLNRKIERAVSTKARGIAYANAGLLDDAERELSAYLADHPDDYRIKGLLRVVRSWRPVQR